MLFNRKAEGPRQPAEPIAPEQPPVVARPSRLATSEDARTQSFIDASLTIVGDLHTDHDVQLDGRICGNVTCARLIVGRDAAITGAVRAEQAIVRGSITGTIRAPTVILQETARVKSDVAYSLLAIDNGAEFEGAAHHSESPLQEAETSPLDELQRTIAVESSNAAASPSHGREQEADTALAKPERRSANGHAGAQR
jgi:cytoskeletal protein CcmA (bactofilin family)